jgi:hypothetical protein
MKISTRSESTGHVASPIIRKRERIRSIKKREAEVTQEKRGTINIEE